MLSALHASDNGDEDDMGTDDVEVMLRSGSPVARFMDAAEVHKSNAKQEKPLHSQSMVPSKSILRCALNLHRMTWVPMAWRLCCDRAVK